MSIAGEILVGLVILVGLMGIVVPILPGVILIAAAVLVWAIVTATTTSWVIFAIVSGLLLISGVVKYAWPARRMREEGIPSRSILAGGLLGIVGFFMVPVIGLLLGFIAGTYAAEAQRLPEPGAAWKSTMHATKAVGLSILIELLGALLAVGTWLGAVLFT